MVPVVFVLLERAAVEVVRACLIAQHREESQPRQGFGKAIEECRKDGDLIAVYPQGLQPRQRRKAGLMGDLVPVQHQRLQRREPSRERHLPVKSAFSLFMSSYKFFYIYYYF